MFQLLLLLVLMMTMMMLVLLVPLSWHTRCDASWCLGQPLQLRRETCTDSATIDYGRRLDIRQDTVNIARVKWRMFQPFLWAHSITERTIALGAYLILFLWLHFVNFPMLQLTLLLLRCKTSTSLRFGHAFLCFFPGFAHYLFRIPILIYPVRLQSSWPIHIRSLYVGVHRIQSDFRKFYPELTFYHR